MSSITHTDPAPTLEEVWRLFRETDRMLKEQARETELRMKEQAREADRRAQEAELRMKEQALEADRRAQEADQRLKEQALEADRRAQEADRRALERAQEAERRSKEFDRQMEEVNKKIGRLGNRLGEFVEELIRPSVVRLFQERGIDVHVVTGNVEANNPTLGLAMQIDLFVSNNDSCALIEVKSNLSLDDVNEHIERMGKFKALFPKYADTQVYGAVAGMVIADNVAKYAYRQGFFVIAPQGDTAVILNDAKFAPKAW